MTCAGGTGCGCDCCTGVEARTPRPVGNPPARPALAYRAGTHPDFLAAMTARLATVTVPVEEFGGSAGLAGTLVRGAVRPPGAATDRPLAALRARGAGDFVPGLLDAWAAVLDVLTFYQERAANEGYLRTATELRSVRELARLVGYAPRPGVAASAHVAYDVDATSPVRIPAGSRVQSVPAAGQTPQTFETTADLVARDRWSKLAPRKARPQVFEPGQTAAGRRVWFAGLATRLNPNDPLLLVFDAARGEPFRVKSVEPDNPAQTTRVVLQDFRTEAVLGDAEAAVRAAVRMYDRATAAFAEAESARRGDGGGDTPADVTRGLAAYRAKLKPGAELKALVEEIGAALLRVFEERAKSLGEKLPDREALKAEGFVSATDARRFIADLRNLIARMEAVREYLTVQRAAARAVALGGLKSTIGYAPKPEHEEAYRALVGRWERAAIETLSSLTLANLLHDTRVFLLDETRVPGERRPGFAAALEVVAEELNDLIRAVVRPVLTRFLRVAQSGVPVDTAVGFDVARVLCLVRNLADPELTDDLKALQAAAAGAVRAAAAARVRVGEVARVRLVTDKVAAARAWADGLTGPFAGDPAATALLDVVNDFLNFREAAETALNQVAGLEKLEGNPTSDRVRRYREALEGRPATGVTPFTPGLADRLDAVGSAGEYKFLADLVRKLAVNLDPTRPRDAAFQANAVLDAYARLAPQTDRHRAALAGLAQALSAPGTGLRDVLTAGADADALRAAIRALLAQPDPFQPAELLDFQPTGAEFGLQAQVTYLRRLTAALEADVIHDPKARTALAQAMADGDALRGSFAAWRTKTDEVFDRLPSPDDPTRVLDLAAARADLTAAAEAVAGATGLRPAADAVTQYLLSLAAPIHTSDGGERRARVTLWVAQALLREVVGPQLLGRPAGPQPEILSVLRWVEGGDFTPYGRFQFEFNLRTDPAELVRQLNRGIWILRQQQRLVAAGAYPRVGPWIDELTAALDRIVSDLTIKETPRPPKDADPAAGLTAYLVPRDPLAALRGDSTRRASDLPPDITVRMAADAGATTQTYSDLAPQLAQAANPAAWRGVYDALANARFVRRERFQGAHVLRAKAAVFGHNATADHVLATGGQDRFVVRVRPVELGAQGFDEAVVDVQFTTRTGTPFTVSVPKDKPSAVGTVGNETLTVTVDRARNTTDPPAKALLTIGVVPKVGPTDGTKRTLVCWIPANAADRVVVRDFTLLRNESATFSDGDEDWVISHDTADDKQILASARFGERVAATRNVLTLDGTHDKVTPGSFVVVERANPLKEKFALDNPLVARVEAVESVTPNEFGLAGLKATRLTLDRPWLDLTDATLADVRGVTVYLQSEPLELAGEPDDADVGPVFAGDPAATELELDEVYDGLPAGRVLVVAGERTDTPGTSGVKDAQVLELDRVEQVVDAAGSRGQGRPHTRLRLRQPLAASYQRGTVTVHGNVVLADHGETKSEVLGSGSAALANQRFALKQLPLTHVAAATPAGAADTLRVRVNGVLWDRADRPAGLTPADRRYTLRQGPDGKWVVVFGDGTHGSRLPTGTENVRAVYRVGVGTAGNVAAGALSQVLTRPLGVRGATNPRPAAGGADPESAAAVRRNAPVGAVALGRLVSVADYEDFARGFAGVARAVAAPFPVGGRRGVHLTVAGPDGAKIDRPDPLYRNLLRALKAHGDPAAGVRVDPRRLLFLTLAVGLRVARGYEYAPVEAAVRARLLAALGFEARDFGRPVFLSDVVAAAHAVPGVDAVTVTRFALIDEPTDLAILTARLREIDQAVADRKWPEQRLTVRPARLKDGAVVAAELAFLPAAPAELLTLTEWTA